MNQTGKDKANNTDNKGINDFATNKANKSFMGKAGNQKSAGLHSSVQTVHRLFFLLVLQIFSLLNNT